MFCFGGCIRLERDCMPLHLHPKENILTNNSDVSDYPKCPTDNLRHCGFLIVGVNLISICQRTNIERWLLIGAAVRQSSAELKQWSHLNTCCITFVLPRCLTERYATLQRMFVNTIKPYRKKCELMVEVVFIHHCNLLTTIWLYTLFRMIIFNIPC